MRHGLQPTKVLVSTANPAAASWLIVSRLSHVGRCGREFYHDQEQSPQSSGNCSNCGHCDDGPCDTGVMPTGEYLWNHANGSMLRDFLVNTYVGGASGLANPNIAIAGASGAVGIEMLKMIESRGFPFNDVRLAPAVPLCATLQ